MVDSIRDSIRIRIATPDSIRYSIRTQTADLQVPTYLNVLTNWLTDWLNDTFYSKSVWRGE